MDSEKYVLQLSFCKTKGISGGNGMEEAYLYKYSHTNLIPSDLLEIQDYNLSLKEILEKKRHIRKGKSLKLPEIRKVLWNNEKVEVTYETIVSEIWGKYGNSKGKEKVNRLFVQLKRKKSTPKKKKAPKKGKRGIEKEKKKKSQIFGDDTLESNLSQLPYDTETQIDAMSPDRDLQIIQNNFSGPVINDGNVGGGNAEIDSVEQRNNFNVGVEDQNENADGAIEDDSKKNPSSISIKKSNKKMSLSPRAITFKFYNKDGKVDGIKMIVKWGDKLKDIVSGLEIQRVSEESKFNLYEEDDLLIPVKGLEYVLDSESPKIFWIQEKKVRKRKRTSDTEICNEDLPDNKKQKIEKPKRCIVM